MDSGFLCPLCMLELPSAATLQEHFDTAHNEEATESRTTRKQKKVVGSLFRKKKGVSPVAPSS